MSDKYQYWCDEHLPKSQPVFASWTIIPGACCVCGAEARNYYDDTRHDPPRADGYPATWVRGTADDTAEATAPAAVQGGEAAKVPVEVPDEAERRIRILEAEVETLKKRLNDVIITLKLTQRHFVGVGSAIEKL